MSGEIDIEAVEGGICARFTTDDDGGQIVDEQTVSWLDILKHAPTAALIEELEHRHNENVDTFRLHGDEEFSFSYFGIHCEIGNTFHAPAVVLIIPEGGV